jgi:hypothetical protein
MKITVITGPDGKVLGTARPPTGAQAEQAGMLHLVARHGQTAHEIEMPIDMQEIQSAELLHKALEKHLKSARQKG